MFMLDYKDTAWWYWLASTTSLWFSIAGEPMAFQIAVGIGVTQLLHFIVKQRSVVSFPVQIRIGYLLFLFLTIPDSLAWMIWIPAIGTLARVVFGYCIMARMLMLMPFNRSLSLTWKFIKEAFLTPPVRGSILHGLSKA